MILVDIDRQKKIPVYKQICLGIKKMISDSTLKVGDRLPSSRQLAMSLGVNRSTVSRAYEELWTEGFLESRPGSYSMIRHRKEFAEKIQVRYRLKK
jgi:DNA-binding transcriptional regulator YhcF (GntR family)